MTNIQTSPVVLNHSSQNMSEYNNKNHSSDKFDPFGYVKIILLIQIKWKGVICIMDSIG